MYSMRKITSGWNAICKAPKLVPDVFIKALKSHITISLVSEQESTKSSIMNKEFWL